MTIINELLKTVTENYFIIPLAVIIISLIAYVIARGKKGIYEAALYLVTVAEEEWGSKTGRIKFAQVISTIKAQYPFLSSIIKEVTLNKLIEDALIEMKKILKEKQEAEEKEAKIIDNVEDALEEASVRR